MMKRLIACLLVLLLAVPVLAEEAAEMPAEEVPVTFAPLPIDLTGGPLPDPDCYTEDSYVDDSITVTMERVTAYGSMFHVAHVKIADASQLRTTISSPLGKQVRTKRIGDMADAVNAVVAIGGDYYGDSARKSGYVVRMGNVLRAGFKAYKRDILIIDQNGDFHILPNTWEKGAYNDKPLRELMTSGVKPNNAFDFGPALVIDGNVCSIPGDYTFNPFGKEPRCAIGQVGPLEYVLVMASGRGDNDSAGVTLPELADFMHELGCQQAYNLDGGNSAMIVFNARESVRLDRSYNGRKLTSGRDVTDIIYFATLVDPAQK